jgi:hypothetical protein
MVKTIHPATRSRAIRHFEELWSQARLVDREIGFLKDVLTSRDVKSIKEAVNCDLRAIEEESELSLRRPR